MRPRSDCYFFTLVTGIIPLFVSQFALPNWILCFSFHSRRFHILFLRWIKFCSILLLSCCEHSRCRHQCAYNETHIFAIVVVMCTWPIFSVWISMCPSSRARWSKNQARPWPVLNHHTARSLCNCSYDRGLFCATLPCALPHSAPIFLFH